MSTVWRAGVLAGRSAAALGPILGRPAAVRLSLSQQVRGGTTRHDTGVTRLTGTRHPAIGTTGMPYLPDRIVAVAATAARAHRLEASQTQPLPGSLFQQEDEQ
jgi:hypothetical protein